MFVCITLFNKVIIRSFTSSERDGQVGSYIYEIQDTPFADSCFFPDALAHVQWLPAFSGFARNPTEEMEMSFSINIQFTVWIQWGAVEVCAEQQCCCHFHCLVTLHWNPFLLMGFAVRIKQLLCQWENVLINHRRILFVQCCWKPSCLSCGGVSASTTHVLPRWTFWWNSILRWPVLFCSSILLCLLSKLLLDQCLDFSFISMQLIRLTPSYHFFLQRTIIPLLKGSFLVLVALSDIVKLKFLSTLICFF